MEICPTGQCNAKSPSEMASQRPFAWVSTTKILQKSATATYLCSPPADCTQFNQNLHILRTCDSFSHFASQSSSSGVQSSAPFCRRFVAHRQPCCASLPFRPQRLKLRLNKQSSKLLSSHIIGLPHPACACLLQPFNHRVCHTRAT